MSSNPFQPQGQSVSIATSTASNGIQVTPGTSTTVCFTNLSRGNAWVTWSNVAMPTAAFPANGNTLGSFGMCVCPGAQVTIGTNNQATYVAAVIDSGTGTLIITPGDGL